jgi:hypothetical protein
MNAPQTKSKGLNTAGRKLWTWLEETCDNVADAAPAVAELCEVTNRLHEVRDAIRKQGVTVEGRKNPLLDVEIKLSAQWVKLWRALGLADKPDEQRRPLGRPPESERQLKWRA